MFQVPLPTVKAELVQFPWVWGVGPRRTCATAAGVGVVSALVGGDVDPEVAGACVVALEVPGPLEPVLGAVVVALDCAGGSA